MNFLQENQPQRLRKETMVTKEESFRGQRAISFAQINIYYKKHADGILIVTSLTGPNDTCPQVKCPGVNCRKEFLPYRASFQESRFKK